MAEQNITRDSHYVPQAILRRWSTDGYNVHAYRTLVSRLEVPEWEKKSIRSVAFQDDLYTVFKGGKEVDEFEQWIKKEYEDPGLEAIDKLINAGRLTAADWSSIARFVAAQDRRTPLNYIESTNRWNQEIPGVLDECVQEAVTELMNLRSQGIPGPSHAEPTELGRLLRVHVEPPADSGVQQATIRSEITVGRGLWIAGTRHILKDAANVLCQHRWSVAEPHGDEEWVTTDHPVLRLNCYSPGKYDFCGGWGNPGSEIVMPVSHRLLLYVKVGETAKNRLEFSKKDTRIVQRLIVERAHRWVFARQPLPWVAEMRPRVVDQHAFVAEANAWKDWHQAQLKAEKL